jgi:TPR repeat protein
LVAQTQFRAGLEAYKSGDYATALQLWRPLAEAGSAEAQFNLGLIYANGRGVDTNNTAAAGWYERAARQGFVRAQYNLASLLEAGEDISPDPVLAYAWFKLAAAQKHADSKKRRKRVAKTLTPHEIAQGDLLAREWKREYDPGDKRTDSDAD